MTVSRQYGKDTNEQSCRARMEQDGTKQFGQQEYNNLFL